MTNSAAKVTISKTTKFQTSEYLTMGIIAQIMDTCRSFEPSTRVSIETHYGQRDSYEGMTITVHGA